MINKSSIIFLILLFCRALTCQGQVIIPSPQQITLTKGCFSIKDKGVTVYAEDSTADRIHFHLKIIAYGTQYIQDIVLH